MASQPKPRDPSRHSQAVGVILRREPHPEERLLTEDEIHVDNHEGGSHQEEETRPVQDDPNPNHEDPPGYDNRIPD